MPEAKVVYAKATVDRIFSQGLTLHRRHIKTHQEKMGWRSLEMEVGQMILDYIGEGRAVIDVRRDEEDSIRSYGGKEILISVQVERLENGG